MDELTDILEKLSLSENKSDELNRIKPALAKFPKEQLARDLSTVDLAVLFDCLNTDKEQQLERTCEILEYALQYLDPVLLLQKYGGILQKGLSHKDPRVPVLAVKQLQRFSQDDELSSLVQSHPIFSKSVEMLAADLSVSSQVFTFLYQMSESLKGVSLVLSTTTLPILHAVMKHNTTIQIRVLELAVKISQISQEHLETVERNGLLKPLLDLLNIDDILVRLSAIDLLTSLAYTQQGLRYLEAHNTLNSMESILKTCRSDPFAETLLPGLIKFFGNISHLRPKQMLAQHPAFLDTVLELTDTSYDPSLRTIAFETVGHIGVSLQGKQALNAIGNKFINSIEKLESLVRDAATEFRIRGMNAFSSLIKLDKENQSEEFCSMTETWYHAALGSRAMALLHGVLKQPFLELRLAVYQMYATMARQGWGRREILRQPGLPELLLDRETERDKDGMDAKYEVVKCLADSGETQHIVGQDIAKKVHEYVKQGPYFILPRSSVALDGGES
eukprot:TRINITY_DN3902_c0_g1_i1.p1 TRINITY_DN3902_c0_g1~~TRINITY_DN3902_c0_g1_i1.p1  ORF type:complete len:504 (-),score=138.03 TRINITY_DN3902_c0_g1_i1:34-1545(-)